jgi:hypothetical protein
MIKVLPLCGVWKLVFRPMRYLVIILTPMVILFSTPVLAEEITMICNFDGQTRTLKYLNPLFGSKKILNRYEGRWQNWGDSNRSLAHVPAKLRITDQGAVLETVLAVEAMKHPPYGLREGDPILRYDRYILDFEFLKRTVYWYETHMNGMPLKNGVEGADPDTPSIEYWSCNKP